MFEAGILRTWSNHHFDDESRKLMLAAVFGYDLPERPRRFSAPRNYFLLSDGRPAKFTTA
jgi:hypothetical protein